MKTKSRKKVLKLSNSKMNSDLKGLDFKIRKAKKIDHASLCADAYHFNSST